MAQAVNLEQVRIALPKGRFLGPTAELLDSAGFGMDDYAPHSRHYRAVSSSLPSVSAKILQERDISVHVSVGNYDLGICGVDWVRELKAGYPTAGLIEVAALDYHDGALFLASSAHSDFVSLQAVTTAQQPIRIASEYPGIATRLAVQLRLRRFRIFPIWGAAEAYPPESADLVLTWAKHERDLVSHGLIPLTRLFNVDAVVVANAASLSRKDLSKVMGPLGNGYSRSTRTASMRTETGADTLSAELLARWQSRPVRMALPDGHQKTPAEQLLAQAKLSIPGYSGRTAERRLLADEEWLAVKVIRPQDMPLQVASGHFDIAVTGQDWLTEHRATFPTSPVKELVDLCFGKVRVVAALSQSIPVESTEELRGYLSAGGIRSLRVASEYTSIADKYLRDNHMPSYRVMPTRGASEAFLPDDADLLIDNTQTGKTLVDNDLKIIEVILRSSACLIANTGSLDDPMKREKIDVLAARLRDAVQ